MTQLAANDKVMNGEEPSLIPKKHIFEGMKSTKCN